MHCHDQNSFWSDMGENMAGLPLIRLNTAMVVVVELEKRGFSADAVLEKSGLTRTAMDNPDTFIHATVMYRFLEEAAAATDDSLFFAKLAEGIDVTNWLNLQKNGGALTTVGSLLTAFAVAATEHSSSIQHSLVVHGKNASFEGSRSFETPFTPGQIDAYFATLAVSTIRRAVGPVWKADDVLIAVSDPKAIPQIFYGVTALKGGNKGYRVNFPSIWLNEPFSPPAFVKKVDEENDARLASGSITAAVRQAVRPYIGEFDLSSKRVAEICGMPHRTLSRKLAAEDQTIGNVLDQMKCDAACHALTDTSQKVTDVADAVGYSDPTSFARAFKRWTGKSPQSFRTAGARR